MSQAKYSLQLLREGEAAESFTIDAPLVVGRAEDCDVRVADRRMSRRHARFELLQGQPTVVDQGSPNGTILNGVRTKQSALKHGDLLVLGRTRFQICEIDPQTDSSKTLDQPELIKPVSQVLPPSLGSMMREDYYAALGLSDNTLLDASVAQLEGLLAKTRNFAVLHQVSQAMQAETDPLQMLGTVLELVLKVTQGSRGYVALVVDGQAPEVQVVRPLGAQGQGLSQTVTDHVLKGRSSVLCSDASADDRLSSSESLFLNETRSLMAVPILHHQTVMGLLVVESSHLQVGFTENDLDLLTIISSTMGVTLENLQLLKKREQTILELEAAQQRLLAAQELLVKSEQMAAIGRLASGITHEVKNHLSPFMLANMIARKYPDDKEIQTSAELMLEAQHHILSLVNEVKDFARGAQSSHEPTDEDLAEVVGAVVRFMQCDAVVRKCKVQIDVQDEPEVQIDVGRFRQVLINLLRNAADAVPESRRGKIELSVSIQEEWAQVLVKDNGQGISEENRQSIFEPFFSTKGDKGLGLGLDISRNIIRAHGGELDFESVLGEGTSFIIRLPLAPL